MRNTKFGYRELKAQFPTDEACADFIFDCSHSRDCSCGGKYSIKTGRRMMQCSKCRFQIAPTAGTIFHKSPTPLTLWFHAIWIFSNAKSGISAKEMERQLNVTYKCAWRILSQIRKALKQGKSPLSGVVETDATYFGGHTYSGKNNEESHKMWMKKSVVMGAVERKGNIKAQVTPNVTAQTIDKFVKESVEERSILMTDSAPAYKKIGKNYDHYKVDHHRGEYARGGTIHVNTMESWFSHIKRSMKGTFKSVSKKHLQSYLDAFAFHHNNRHNDRERFGVLLGTILHA